MTNTERKEKREQLHSDNVAKDSLRTTDSHQIRNARTDEIKAVHNLNINAHSGSSGGDSDDGSIQIFALNQDGSKKIVAERQKTRSQSNAFDSGVALALKGKDNPVAHVLSLLKEHCKKMLPGPEKENLSRSIKEQTQEIFPNLKADAERFSQSDNADSMPALSETKQTEHDWFSAGQEIAALPIEKQVQIIGTALIAGMEQYRNDEQERRWGAVIGSIQGLGNVAVNLSKIADFSAYCIIGDEERAGEMAKDFGTALGQTIVSGVKLFGCVQKYSYDIGYSGDYQKPLRDILAVGNFLNEQWSQLPPREQERRKYEFLSQMLADGIVGAAGVQAIGKSKAFTEILDQLAEQVAQNSAKSIESTRKLAGKIGNFIGDLTSPELALPAGGSLKPGRFEQIEEQVLRMAGRSGEYIPERKPLFLSPSQNKVLNGREVDTLGGLQKLENMSDSDLAAIGLKRYELPTLKLETDEFSIKASIFGDNKAWFHASVTENGAVVLRYISKGRLPDGTGSHFIAEALKAHNVIPKHQLVLQNIINEETANAIKNGFKLENTKLSRMGTKALKELGLKPSHFSIERMGVNTNLVIWLE